MTTLTTDSLKEDTTIATLAKALPNYLSWCTHSEMSAVLTGADTGAVDTESRSKTLYKDNFTKVTGTLKASPYTSSTDETTNVTTHTYGTVEDVTYSYTLQASAEALTSTHEESESTIYHFSDVLDGKTPVSTFSYTGDFWIPEYLPFTLQDYLDPSTLVSALNLLTLDKSACSLADGLLTLKGTDYASDYLLSIKDNKITQVVETPLGDNVACYGSKAVLTKTYVLSAPEITAYAE